MEDDIYMNCDDFDLQETSCDQPGTLAGTSARGTHHTRPEMGTPPQPTAATVRYRRASVCLGLICALLLGSTIGLAIIHTLHTHQLQALRDQLLTERNELLTERDQFRRERDQLLSERDQLNRTKEIYKTLSFEFCNLVVDLKKPRCRSGWLPFRCSCYHMRCSARTQPDARQYCQSFGGDLVAIDSLDEQLFLRRRGLSGWIGLRRQGTDSSWRWMDDSPLSTGYWAPNTLQASGNCVMYLNPNWAPEPSATWKITSCASDPNYPICEVPAFTLTQQETHTPSCQ